ncbi:hypothetical protein LCGC14_1499030, partial [marine sediment metagenome]
ARADRARLGMDRRGQQRGNQSRQADRVGDLLHRKQRPRALSLEHLTGRTGADRDRRRDARRTRPRFASRRCRQRLGVRLGRLGRRLGGRCDTQSERQRESAEDTGQGAARVMETHELPCHIALLRL